MGINVLAGLLDEKLIKIISLFLKFPDKKFYMSEVSRQSGINSATTFRVLQKLVKEEFIKAVVIGKVRTYQLSNGERARALSRLLRTDEPVDALTKFCNEVKKIPRIKMILLDNKTATSAKVIIISDFSNRERLDIIARNIHGENNFKVTFVELKQTQYEGLKGSIGDKRILFKSTNPLG